LVRGLGITGAAALSILFDIFLMPIAFRGFRVCSLDNTKLSFIGLNFNSSCVLFENFEAKLVATVEKY